MRILQYAAALQGGQGVVGFLQFTASLHGAVGSEDP